MNPGTRRRAIRAIVVLSVVAVGSLGLSVLYRRSANYGIPYRAQFDPRVADRWEAFGGTWEVEDGAVRNDSNDRGARLLTGSEHWKDYTVESDVLLLGSGSAGVLARASEPEVGENSFKGYLAAVRTGDNSLILGTYDYAYHEAIRVPMPEVVTPLRWYHVSLTVRGCQISVSARADGMRDVVTTPLTDPDCFRAGRAGLRSNGTGGIWRNFAVLPAEGSLPRAGGTMALPDTTALQKALALSKRPFLFNPSDGEGVAASPLESVLSLHFLSPLGSPQVTVRGLVVLVRPAVYVQDSRGGAVKVEPGGPATVKIGDEVEATGNVSLDEFTPVIHSARFHLLREEVPAAATALTAHQVATGQYDGRFVQLDGILQSVSAAPGGKASLQIEAGAQSFHALLQPGRGWWHVRNLALQSRVRVRGVAVVDPRFNDTHDPFVLLLRSAEDVDVVAGPPWWRPSTLILIAGTVLALGFLLNHLYLLAKHWRYRVVAEERERLAHQIHDTLAQSFAGIGFQLQAIRNTIKSDPELLKQQVELAMSMARTSHEEARRSIAGLRPESLGHNSLLLSLRQFAEKMVKNGAVKIETYGDETGIGLSVRVKDTLYKIGQEAIANSIRHADPSTIRIRLAHRQGELCIAVEDDGRGMPANSDATGFGIPSMRRKAESIAASLVIASNSGAGTQVEIRVAAGFQPRRQLRRRAG